MVTINKEKEGEHMSDLSNYVNGQGKIESPNEGARAVIVQDMQQQGLRQIFRPQLERMSFFLSEETVPDAAASKVKYILQWRGDISG